MTAQNSAKRTRGEANNNPGNILYNPANDWVGQIGIEPTRTPGQTPRFACFNTPVNGGRAIAVLLQSYQAKGFRTVRSLIERWAPPSENNSAAYVAAVARAAQVDPDAEIDVKDYRILRPLLEAIIRQENGRLIYSAAQLDEIGLSALARATQTETRGMIGILAWAAGSSWGRVAALGFLFAAAFGLILWRIFSAGKTAARTESLERTIHALTTRMASDENLRALEPAARRERLRQWASDP